MIRLSLCGIALFALSVSRADADTLLTQAKVLEVTPRGFILQVGTQPLGVEDGPEARLWVGFSPVERDVFTVGQLVRVRIKTDADPPILREMADEATWGWLEKLRKEPQKAVLEKVDAKTMTLKFADGKTFAYRYTDKTEFRFKNLPNAGPSALEPGMAVYAKGRLLSNLDTWLVMLSDTPIEPPKSAAKPKAAPKLAPLPAKGRLEGRAGELFPKLSMFDLVLPDRTLHVTYGLETQFFYQGRPALAGSIQSGMRCVVQYARDRSGRIVASKVELFPSSPP